MKLSTAMQFKFSSPYPIGLFISCLITSGPSKAEEKSDIALIDSFFSNIRWVADASSRVIHSDANDIACMQMLGLDIHSVIGNPYQDYGTLILQTYFVRIDNLSPHPDIYNDENDWAFTYRNFNFNYTNTCRSCPNIKVGHFLLPYGLEHSQDTMGQLIDYNHVKNLGYKADWGITLNKQHRKFEYELGYSLGSGQKLQTKANQYMLTGRIGTLRNTNQVYGLSFVDAEVKQLKRQKVAIDMQFYRHFWGFLTEFSWGKQQKHSTTDSLIELNWRNDDESLLLYSQATHNTVSGQASRRNWIAGLRYEPDNNLSLEVKLIHPLHSTANGLKPWIYIAQLRYRY